MLRAPLSLLSLGVAVVVAILIVAHKAETEDTRFHLGARRPGLGARSNPSHGPALEPAEATADDGDDSSGTLGVPPVEQAVLGDKGGVPTHSGGRFRSPFSDPSVDQPPDVRFGMVLNDVGKFDIREGLFEADFFLSLTSAEPIPASQLTFTNGTVDSREVLANLPTFKLYRYKATFTTPIDLRQYPFDTQDLTIEIEDNSAGLDQLHIVPDKDHTQLDVGLRVPGWEVEYLEARVLNHYYPDRFDNDDLYYARYKVSLGVRRFATSAAFTVFVPALVIVLISMSGLWLPRSEFDARSNAVAPMLAAAVLFHFALVQELPGTAYLTRADKVMLAVYACLVVNMAATMLWFVFDERHEERIFRWGRLCVPPISVIIMLMGSLL